MQLQGRSGRRTANVLAGEPSLSEFSLSWRKSKPAEFGIMFDALPEELRAQRIELAELLRDIGDEVERRREPVKV